MAAQAPGYISCTADTLAKSGTGVLYGITVTSALSAAAVTIYDSLTEANTALMVIPASTAAGGVVMFPQGIRFKTGLYIGFAGTGTVVVIFD